MFKKLYERCEYKEHKEALPLAWGKENLVRLVRHCLGALPLAWEKDSVFMQHSEIFNVICMKNFYKMATETIYKFKARKPLL